MAMKDIKSFTVPPEDEDKTVQLWMAFGWELKSTQEVKTQDVQKFTGQDKDGTEHYQTTRGEHYIKLTFERDPERKNYAELKALEKQYNAPLPGLHTISPGNKPKKPGVIALILMIISFFVGVLLILIGATSGGGTSFIVFGVIFILLGIRSIMRRTSFPSKLKSWEAENEAYQTNHAVEEKALSEAKKKRADALEKAKSLV